MVGRGLEVHVLFISIGSDYMYSLCNVFSAIEFLCSLFSGYIIVAFVCPSADEGFFFFLLFLTLRVTTSYFAF